MDKLETILRAEEAARHTVAEARESAGALLRDAEVQARAIADNARADSAEQAASIRVAALDAAGREADAIRVREAEDLEASLAAARGRLDSVAARVAGELVG